MTEIDFDTAFRELTGNAPFPWQRALYEQFISGRDGNIPKSCNLPTGLGKTSVIAVWLLALANGARVPRRLVYVVNRRTVVDQTTDEVMRYRQKLAGGEAVSAAVSDVAERLQKLAALPGVPLAISTLRGQYADNREWSSDPARAAVICGTVDMIGSRLLFSGYGCGFKTRPLHAGFLGQDSLIVHDEAHLEPAFQELLLAIEKEQHEGRTRDFRPLKVMELTATSRAGTGKPFELTDDDKKNATVKERLGANKLLHLHQNKDAKKLADEIAAKAKECGERFPGSAVIVFVRSVNDVEAVTKKLPAGSFEKLTGTLRGYERDGLVTRPIFRRFLPGAVSDDKTVYLVCTSAGEVGVNISADHLVCDLSTFESMAQRFGRVNRFGKRPDTEVHVIYPKEFQPEDDYELRRKRTLGLLELLKGDASPAALGELRQRAIAEGASLQPATSDAVQALRDYVSESQSHDPRLGGFAAPPDMLPTSDILFDAWALTTVRELPGRPPVEPYLHGVEDDKQRETQVAWRAEVPLFARHGVSEEQIGALLDEFPLRPHELLRDRTDRVQDHFAALAKEYGEQAVWVIEPDDTVRVLTLAQLAVEDNKGYTVNLSARTVVLPPAAGGLTETGTLDGKAEHDTAREYDVGGQFLPASGVPLVRLTVSATADGASYAPTAPVLNLADAFRFELDGVPERTRLREVFPKPLPAMRVAHRIDLGGDADDVADGPTAYLVLRPEALKGPAKRASAWPALEGPSGHLVGVKTAADGICSRLGLSADVVRATSFASAWHDLGKDRGVWQRGAGNVSNAKPVAKTLHGRPPENLNGFRHELASLVDVRFEPAYRTEFEEQTPACQELLQHQIATHHGRGRPHFPAKEALDPERPEPASRTVVTETPQRFARLQSQYGRWGLAYLESLLRAADAIDSKRIEDTPVGPSEPGTGPRKTPTDVVWTHTRTAPVPTISVDVDPFNPGQFFACCGLLELADRLGPGAEGWFENGKFHIACAGTLGAVFDALTGCVLTNTMATSQHARADELSKMSTAQRKAAGAEDEYKALGALLRESPITLKDPFDITLDWFADNYAGGSRFKTWAGQQSVLTIATAMKDALKGQEWRNEGCLTYSVAGCGLPFNFDSDLGAQGGAIDVGFSFDPLAGSALTRIESSARPALELLAFIGLQRFRPQEIKGENRFLYTAWEQPLPVAVAMPAACGAVPVAGTRYEFRLLYRTKYLKSFLPAVPFTGGSDE